MLISGQPDDNVFGMMRYEIGVHRVQRIPDTETQGRLHTSTMTVAVLPHSKSIVAAIENKDVKIETFRAGGKGGQHVNTTDSAVRLTHIPSGVVVSIQDERSQVQNKDKAWKVMAARVYDLEHQKKMKERAERFSSQVGDADRSARVRTYNFPQDRITDHRVPITLNGMDEMLQGQLLTEIHDGLRQKEEDDHFTALKHHH